MAKLEDITVGSHLTGIAGNEPVDVVAVQWYGNNVIEITYKNSKGVPGHSCFIVKMKKAFR